MSRVVDLLEHWFAREQISRAEHEMGQRLRRAFDLTIKGGLDGRGAVPPDMAARARDALRRLLPLLGEDRNHVTIAMLCRGFTADDVRRAFGALGIASDDDARRMVRASLAAMVRHRWGTSRETPAVDIPELMQVLSDDGFATVDRQA